MKFAVCSLTIGKDYKELMKKCTKSQEDHARLHGYDRITDESIFCPHRHPTWSKILLIQKYLSEYEFILWIDGDVMIMNFERKIEEFINLLPKEKFLLIGRDFQGLNGGIFLIRNCEKAHAFLADVWKRDDMSHKLFHEQTAMDDLIKTTYKGCARIIPHEHISIFNAYDYRMDERVCWKPGDFCIHFAGIKNPQDLANLQDMYSRFTSSDPEGTYRIERFKNKMLIDTFPFYNELDVLELRLTLLDEYVDMFVLVESELTFVGAKKELFFENNKERFKKWLPKIEHVILREGEIPATDDPWVREKFQRGSILRGLERCSVSKESIVMLSDVDEIPDLAKIPFEGLPHIVTSVHMWNHVYSFKYMNDAEPWIATVLTNYELFKRSGPNYLRDNRWKFPAFNYSGWHLSSFGNAAHVHNKIRNFSHAFDGHHESQTLEEFESFVSQGIFTDGKTKLRTRPAEVPLPGSVEVLQRLHLLESP